MWNMTLTSHSCPANSGGHWHTNPSNTAWHWPPFWHGLLSHLFLWISQWTPTKPGGHRQWWPPGPSYRKHKKGKWWERAKSLFWSKCVQRCKVQKSWVKQVPCMLLHSGTDHGSRCCLERKKSWLSRITFNCFHIGVHYGVIFQVQVTHWDVHRLGQSFGKETSGAKRVPDKPLIDCDWACIGSGERHWACKFSHDGKAASWVLPRGERNGLPHVGKVSEEKLHLSCESQKWEVLTWPEGEGRQWNDRDVDVTFFFFKKKGRNTDWCHSSVRTIPENSRSDIRQSNFCKSERSHRASVRTHFYLWRQDVEEDRVHQLKQTKGRTHRGRTDTRNWTFEAAANAKNDRTGPMSTAELKGCSHVWAHTGAREVFFK